VIKDFETTVQTVKEQLPNYLEEHGINITRNFKCLDPAHEDSNPSCRLLPDNIHAYCFSCHKIFDIFDAVQVIENRPKNGRDWIVETLSYLGDKYSIKISEEELTQEDKLRIGVTKLYSAVKELLLNGLATDPSKTVLQEIEKRKWSIELLKELGIGCLPSKMTFKDFLAQIKDLSDEEIVSLSNIEDAGVFKSENLIFTWTNLKNYPVGFSARTQNPNQKYLNLKNTQLFRKSENLFGIGHVNKKGIDTRSIVYIVEGQADAITAYHNDILALATCGSAIGPDHISLLQQLGLTKIRLCFDGDATGKLYIDKSITALSDIKSIRTEVVLLPDKEDPDSFIRKNGPQTFLDIPAVSAFKWKLLQSNDTDPVKLCKEMAKLIVSEPSPIERELLCRELADHTNISLRSITEEVTTILDAREFERSQERSALLERLAYELKIRPSNAEQSLREGLRSLAELSKKHDVEVLSSETFIEEILIQKEKEEHAEATLTGFALGQDLYPLEGALSGDWTQDVFLLIGGKPNTSKTALCCKLTYTLPLLNDNVMTIYHTIDDTIGQAIPRLVCIASNTKQLTIQQVQNPKLWTTKGIDVTSVRDEGYKKILQMAKQEKLISKDITHGSSLAFMEAIISFYQEKYPDRKIVYILDNFHKLQDYKGLDERIRYKRLSSAVKSIAERYHIPIFSTVEYTKIPPGTKPTNHNLAETVSIEYDASFILHLYSEMADVPEAFTTCHREFDWQNKEVLLPRIECMVGKNKISDFKGRFFLDFWPASSDLRFVHSKQVLEDQKLMLKLRRGG